MLIAVLLVFLLVSNQGDANTNPVLRLQQTQERLPKVVKETARADPAARILTEVQGRHKAYVRGLADLQIEFLEVDRSYEVTEGDYEPLIAKLDALQDEHHREMVGLRDRLKTHLTKKEWKKLFK